MTHASTVREKRRLVQAPCTPTGALCASEADALAFFPDVLQRLDQYINLCSPRPHPTALEPGSDSTVPAHPLLSLDDQARLNALLPVQGWLRDGLLERDEQTGWFAAPTPEVFVQRLEAAIETTKLAMQALTERSMELEAFRVQLPSWLALMVVAADGKVEVTDAMVHRLRAFGVQTQTGCVTPVQWVLLLAAAQRSLEQRWVACSVAHHVAFMSVQRAQLLGLVADALHKVLQQVRVRIEPDPDRGLPADLQWIDVACRNPLDAVWCVKSAPQ